MAYAGSGVCSSNCDAPWLGNGVYMSGFVSFDTSEYSDKELLDT